MEMEAYRSKHKVVTGFTLAAFGLCAATLVMIPSAVKNIFSTGFLPHRYCYLYDKPLIALHIGTDTAIWLSYVAISCTLVFLVWKTRREVPFSWMFLAFGLFIVACGFTHLMEVVVLWKPLYWLAGDVKLVTALASIVTAIALPGLIPQARDMVAAAHVSEDRRLQLERANSELQQLSARVIHTQEEERRRIARDLHDGIGQYMVAIKMSCGVALAKMNGAEGTAALQDALSLLDQCTSEVRTMSHLLHPPLLDELGLASSVPWYVDGFTKRSGIEVKLVMPVDMGRLPQPVETALFRVLQESLTNIHRHSGSKMAKIVFQMRDRQLQLSIEDSGKGLAPTNGEQPKTGIGIAGMRERMRELGGDLSVHFDENGTRVLAVVPLGEHVNGDRTLG